jgi:hypothetical protein
MFLANHSQGLSDVRLSAMLDTLAKAMRSLVVAGATDSEFRPLQLGCEQI